MATVEQRLKQANGQLKAGKFGVSLQVRGDRLYIVGTFPAKPLSQKDYPHQQRIATGYRLSHAGIDQAVAEAKRYSLLLTEGRFDWAIVTGEMSPQSYGDWINKLEGEYLQRRLEEGTDRERAGQTWKGEYLKAFQKIPDWGKPLDVKSLEAILKQFDNSRTRRRIALGFACLCDCAGIDHNFRDKTGSYSPKAVNPRTIPNDDEIAKCYESIKSEEWRCAYGLMACYGLRNYEVFKLSFDDFPILFVHKGKTHQERYVFPLYPEWVNGWLNSIILPQCSGKNTDLGNRVTHAFKRENTPFSPYNLRHAWARRSLEFGWDVSLAASQMGHSVKVHTDIYHHWISRDTYQKAYERLVNSPDRPLAP